MTYDDVLRESIKDIPGSSFGIASFLTRTVNIVTFLAFSISFVMFAYSFIQFATSTGDEKAVGKSKKTMTWTAVGMIAAFLLQAFKIILLKLLGFEEGLFL